MSSPTEALYWENTYLFEANACVLSVSEADPKTGCRSVVLTRTIFYPQGGTSHRAAFLTKL